MQNVANNIKISEIAVGVLKRLFDAAIILTFIGSSYYVYNAIKHKQEMKHATLKPVESSYLYRAIGSDDSFSLLQNNSRGQVHTTTHRSHHNKAVVHHHSIKHAHHELTHHKAHAHVTGGKVQTHHHSIKHPEGLLVIDNGAGVHTGVLINHESTLPIHAVRGES
jgi:hypothetical protein